MSQADVKVVEQDHRTSEQDLVGQDDVNAFLISFLESDEDQLNCVSIRLSVIEFID